MFIFLKRLEELNMSIENQQFIKDALGVESNDIEKAQSSIGTPKRLTIWNHLRKTHQAP